MEWGNFDI